MLSMYEDLLVKGWKALVAEKEYQIQLLKRDNEILKEKCEYLAENAFRKWLIEKRPQSFDLPVPIEICERVYDPTICNTEFRTTVRYKRVPSVGFQVEDIVLELAKNPGGILRILDTNDHRSIEPMWEQHAADQKRIRELEKWKAETR